MNNLEANVPAIVNGPENILIAAQEDVGFDKILKFKKGDYFIGEQKVPLLTKYIAHPEAWTKCWTKFEDNKVVDRRLYRVARGEKPPEREDLDEQDESTWRRALTENRGTHGSNNPCCRWKTRRAARLSSLQPDHSAESAPLANSARHGRKGKNAGTMASRLCNCKAARCRSRNSEKSRVPNLKLSAGQTRQAT